MSILIGNAPYWPQRLLHVKTMTSVVRRGDSTYGNDSSPAYNAISYTWGRWEIPRTDGVQALEINGVWWDIPAIHPDHFTPAMFRRAIARASQDCEYVWLDIACIDQKDDVAKAHEVGKQAAIFRGANFVFVWLNRTSEETMNRTVEGLWNSHNGPFCSEIARERLLLGSDCKRFLDLWYGMLSTLFEDPWFSSLWTFQEAYLRRDAELLHRDAEVVSTTTNLYRIFYSCATLHTHLNELIFERDSESTPDNGSCSSHPSSARAETPRLDGEAAIAARRVLQCIEESGCDALARDNPIALYNASSRRKATRSEDYIYGIMQIYGLALGKSADPKAEYSRAQLSRQLGQELISRSPVMGQLFVHMEPPEPKQSWCVQKSTVAPMWVHGFIKPVSHCKISFRGGEVASYEGKVCKYKEIVSFWRLLNKDLSKKTTASVQKIYIDATTRNMSTIPKELQSIYLSRDDRQYQLSQALEAEYGPNLSILLIGTVTAVAGGKPVLLWMGVMVCEQEDDGSTLWQRVGICLWEDVSSRFQAVQERLFSNCKLTLE